MKIYSSEENKPTFTDFAGKDVWVRCCHVDYLNNDNGSDHCTGVVYVRVLGTTADGVLMYNRIDGGTVEWALESNIKDSSDTYGALWDFVDHYSGAYRDRGELSKIYVITSPLKTIASSELLPDTTELERVFKKISGTDVWVKVLDLTQNDYCYLRVLNIDNLVVSYSYIEADIIDDWDPSNYADEDLYYALKSVHRDTADGIGSYAEWQLYKPLETLTTSEIAEILEHAESTYSDEDDWDDEEDEE